MFTALLGSLALAVEPVRFASQGTLIVPTSSDLRDLGAADLDGDGNTDVVHSDGDGIVWYPNLVAVFGAPQRLGSLSGGPYDLAVFDGDADGDDDLAAGSFLEADVRWFENGGDAGFLPPEAIDPSTDPIAGLGFGDIDGDGDGDLMAGTAIGAGSTGWYENLGGTFGPRLPLFPATTGRLQLTAADLDGDGRADPVATSAVGPIGWVADLGGGAFGPEQPIGTRTGASAAVPVDLDGDGDVDLVAAYPDDEDLRSPVWYENLGGGAFAAEQALGGDLPGVAWVAVADLDGDGDADLAAAPTDGIDRMEWYQNLGGGQFSTASIVTDDGAPRGLVPLDVDLDGDLDLLAALFTRNPATTAIVWFENHGDETDPEPEDLCTGDDATGDADSDGACADVDCDDGDPTVWPGAPEVCDGRDNGCAGEVPVGEVDGDGDGLSACAGDCDDTDEDRNPSASEACNGIDDNCDGRVEPQCADDPLEPSTDGCGCASTSGGGGVLGLLLVVGSFAFRRASALWDWRRRARG